MKNVFWKYFSYDDDSIAIISKMLNILFFFQGGWLIFEKIGIDGLFRENLFTF